MKHYIAFPTIEMRENVSRQSKVVSQAIYSEEVQIELQEADRLMIMTPDGYTGWVDTNAVVATDLQLPEVQVKRLSAHVYERADTEYGPLLTLPYNSKLHLLDSSDPRWSEVRLLNGQKAFIQKGDLELEVLDLVTFSQKFLGLPYTWGGRSSFGYDCSGYVQMLYQQYGIQLPRDARQQILDPRCEPVEQIELGDLIFWGKSEGEIKHVGMSLGGDRFIHTSVRENKPYLRISHLTDPEWTGHKGAFYPFRTARRVLGFLPDHLSCIAIETS